MTLYLVTPLRPALAEVPAQESLGLHRVEHNTEVALGGRPRGLDLGRRTPAATEAAEEAQPFLEAAGGTEAQTGPALWTVPRPGRTRSFSLSPAGGPLGPQLRLGWRQACRQPAAETGHCLPPAPRTEVFPTPLC